jgi:hypothetical protein
MIQSHLTTVWSVLANKALKTDLRKRESARGYDYGAVTTVEKLTGPFGTRAPDG